MGDRARAGHILLLTVILLFTVVLIRNAWLCDDAYITFRTIDNFVNGHGLTWNVGERVQSYTHPLWLLLLIPFYAVTHDIYYLSIFLSLALVVATACLVSFCIARGVYAAVLGLAILTLSKSFMDFATSGLEYPLSFCLLALFLVVRQRQSETDRTWLILVVIASLLMLNRLDLSLLVLPPLGVTFLARRSRRALLLLLLGLAPLILWELFSLLYYGFPFPNTAYAKLNTGLPAGSLIVQGFRYLGDAFLMDPLAPLTILAAVILAFATRQRSAYPYVVGIVLYVLYTVRIGGDFMAGRFLTPPLFVAVMLALRWERLQETRIALPAVAAALLVGFLSPHPPPLSGADYGAGLEDEIIVAGGIADERAFYYPHTGLLGVGRRAGQIDHEWANNGRRARLTRQSPLVKLTIGFFGFYAGPRIHIIDRFGLADALLARLPPQPEDEWRIGHLKRTVPRGYAESVAHGRNLLHDPRLASYYDVLSLITRGPLLSGNRLQAIVAVNLGGHRRELAAYIRELEAARAASQSENAGE